MTIATPSLPAAQPVKAAIWMLGAISAFSSMAIAGRALGPLHDTFEIMMYRSLIGLVSVVTVGGLLGTLREVNTRLFHIHLARNIFHFTGQNLWFYAVTVIPLAQVFALEFTSPLWVTLFAPLILGERLTRVRTLAALLGFIGILIVARPGAGELNMGVITGATAALGFAGAILFTKLLTRTATITCILFWLTAQQVVFGVVCAGWDGDIALPSAVSAPWLLVVGCAGLIAHLCMTNALKIAPATVVVPFDFLRLPLIAVVGMVFYGEALDLFIILGALLIFAANFMNVWNETRPVTVS